ncbi:unnamed protein product [Orchesella dallaii]|uniref:BTB domain-containing protein n=1 Tax=Orchesella dallaii TaxID=48710 RepID=A0ABP1PM55_9HEXA
MTNEKELYIHAESSRPRAATLRSDLADLLDFKWNSDVNLILPPAIFPAHKAILMQRSKYFRNLLNNSMNTVNVNVEDANVDIPTFSGLLRYLYTEEIPSASVNTSSSSSHDQHTHEHVGIITRPSKPLESDLRDLLQTGKYSDIVLVLGDEQLPVHKPILAARSPFFRSLLQRRSNSKKIVLDDTVIPKRYARVILHCMYTDKVDLTLIEACRSGLSEVESLTFTGKVNPSGFEEAMELYQIGRFLEFEHLCVCSEDIIVEQLNQDSLPQILRWSCQSHGSAWVKRQAVMYVQEEYVSLISTPSFLELDKTTLLEVVQSDFLQASEIEVLNSIIKWGEHQLIKRVEDREPNLVSSTRDSVFRNNPTKAKRRNQNRDHAFPSDLHLNDGELRDIVFELIRCVRTDHIALSNETLVNAVRRGLISIPPTHMITEEKVNPWVNNLQCPNYIRPRLYTPYYEEAKSAFRSRAGNQSNSTENLNPAAPFQSSSHLAYLNSIGRIKTLRPIIPDTLYMIDNDLHTSYSHSHPHRNTAYAQTHEINKQIQDSNKNIKQEPSSSHVNDTKSDNTAVVEDIVEQELLNAMLYREKKLRSAHLRNLNNPISRERAARYIRLRVVREFGFPDYVAELLDHHNRASLNSSNTTSSTTQTTKDQKEGKVVQSAASSSISRSPTHSSCAYAPPPPEFHNMPDVAMNTSDERVVEQPQQQRGIPNNIPDNHTDSVLIPLLDLDLGDNLGILANTTLRTRNRTFASLNTRHPPTCNSHINRNPIQHTFVAGTLPLSSSSSSVCQSAASYSGPGYGYYDPTPRGYPQQQQHQSAEHPRQHERVSRHAHNAASSSSSSNPTTTRNNNVKSGLSSSHVHQSHYL